MAAYRGADPFRAPTDQVMGSGTWALRVSPSQCIWRVLLISSFVSFLLWKCCLQLIRLTFPGHRKDPFPPETSLNRADVDGSRPRRLFQADFALSISLAGFISPQRIVTMFGSSLLWQLWQTSSRPCASFNVLGNSNRTLSLLFLVTVSPQYYLTIALVGVSLAHAGSSAWGGSSTTRCPTWGASMLPPRSALEIAIDEVIMAGLLVLIYSARMGSVHPSSYYFSASSLRFGHHFRGDISKLNSLLSRDQCPFRSSTCSLEIALLLVLKFLSHCFCVHVRPVSTMATSEIGFTYTSPTSLVITLVLIT